MAHPVEWSIDPSHYEWTYDENAQATVATTTTVVRTYFYPGRMHEGVEAKVPPAPSDVLTAYLGQPLGLWNFPPEPLSDVEMEPGYVVWASRYCHSASSCIPFCDELCHFNLYLVLSIWVWHDREPPPMYFLNL